jgi:dihydrodipicolinate synthase/N-acetylneuraminate lyase
MGMCTKGVRLPLCELQPENLKKLQTVLKKYKLI